SGGGGNGGRGGSSSALALSWSEESPGWKDVPLPPPASPRRAGGSLLPSQTAATAASSPSSSAASSSSFSSSSRALPARSTPGGYNNRLNTATTSTSSDGSFRVHLPPARTSPSQPASLPLRAPPGQDLDILTPAPLACRASGVASTSGRPPPDAFQRLLILPTTSSLAYLDGTLPGDCGFDPLGLFDPSNGSAGFMSQRWLHAAELIHGRWAMLAAAGCLAPEYLAHEKVIPKATGVLWFKTGFLPAVSAGFDYGLPLGVLAGVQVLLMGVAEGLRWAEYRDPGCLHGAKLLGLERLIATTRPGSAAYPGGLMFNPLGLGVRPAVMREYQQAEVRHGRLAMLAFLGYAAQAVVAGRGPYDCWNKHLEDPERYNVLSLLLAPPGGQ
ncbi:hypothetical protein Agub_g15431, partial [Astrephomene gubernaculifera]